MSVAREDLFHLQLAALVDELHKFLRRNDKNVIINVITGQRRVRIQHPSLDVRGVENFRPFASLWLRRSRNLAPIQRPP